MFFLIDKPIGMSSFEVLKKLRKTLGIKKIGHGGTLDPLATGCMIVATEKSTKLLSLLDHASKEYICTIRLDGKSESLDAGTPIEPVEYSTNKRSWKEIEEYILSQKEQIPPKYSALHIDGVRAYSLARAGIDFEIKKRPIEVTFAKVLSQTKETITIHIHLSSGGYVRSFAPIIGAFLGSEGGYITSLRRVAIHTQYGSWRESDLSPIEHPSHIDYTSIFSAIQQKEISEEIYTKLILGKEIEMEIENIPEGSLLFLCFEKKYTSLCRYQEKICTIIRNDVL